MLDVNRVGGIFPLGPRGHPHITSLEGREGGDQLCDEVKYRGLEASVTSHIEFSEM